MRLSDSHNQSETSNPPKISQILKNCNKLIAKNIASTESRTQISYIPCERPKSLDYRSYIKKLRVPCFYLQNKILRSYQNWRETLPCVFL